MIKKDTRHYQRLDKLLSAREKNAYALTHLQGISEFTNYYCGFIDQYQQQLERLVFASCGGQGPTLRQYEVKTLAWEDPKHLNTQGLRNRLWRLSELHVPIRQFINRFLDYKGLDSIGSEKMRELLSIIEDKFYTLESHPHD
jgi:hypothetical protein